MNRNHLEWAIAEVIDSKHATSVLRHDVLDPVSREEFIRKLAGFIDEVLEREGPPLIIMSPYDADTGTWGNWEASHNWAINDDGMLVVKFSVRAWEHSINLTHIAICVGNKVKVVPVSPPVRIAKRGYAHVYQPLDWEFVEP